MRILFLNSSLTSGGAERVMTILANKFSDIGIDTTMSLVRELGPDTYKVNDKVKLVRYKYRTHNKAVIALKRFIKIRNQIKYGNFDAVIVFMNDLSLITLMAAWNLGTPIYISERADPSKRNDSILYKLLERIYYPKCTGMVFQTNDVMEQFSEEIKKKGCVIPNPVAENLPEPYMGLRQKKIVAVGRLDDQKNFSMLINAFSLLHKNYSDYCLYIYGIGPKEIELKELVSTLGIRDFVFFPGFVFNLMDEIKDAAMYVSSSNYEGISNAMIEAMAMGVPVICTDCPVGGARMMIKSGINGLLIPVGDEKALYENMECLLNKTELVKKISCESLKVRNEYSSGKIAAMWLDLIAKKTL